MAIQPRPENLQAVVDGREIQITGDLTEDDKYTVTLKPPFTSRERTCRLRAKRTKSIEFKHLEPELALPSDNQAQLANGSRIYQVQTVNLTSLRVRIKKLAGTDLVRAYQGYRHYTGSGPDGNPIQPTAPLPWSLVAGETSPRQGNPARQRDRYLKGNHPALG